MYPKLIDNNFCEKCISLLEVADPFQSINVPFKIVFLFPHHPLWGDGDFMTSIQ